jgi:hypothetical protein
MAWDLVNQHQLESGEPFDALYNDETASHVLEQHVARPLGVRHRVSCCVVEGAPVEALLGAGKDAELLVIGARGMGAFRACCSDRWARRCCTGPRARSTLSGTISITPRVRSSKRESSKAQLDRVALIAGRIWTLPWDPALASAS